MVEPAEETIIARHLARSLPRYWAAASAATPVRFRKAQRRPGARLYWYDLDLPDGRRALVVKVPHAQPDLRSTPAGRERPRLVTPMDPEQKYEREFAALRALDAYYGRINDPRFRTIRPLDMIDEIRGFVTEVVPGSSLKRQFAAASRPHLTDPPSALWTAIEHSGAWLRAYHRMPMPQAMARQAERADFVANVRRFAEHLTSIVGRVEPFRSVMRAAESCAASLPDPLPLGLTHGDFAMRNVVITPGGQVAVLDTLAQWRAPIYEDIAKFGLSLRWTRPQVLSRRLAFSASRLERATKRFHAGYFGDSTVPHVQIVLYELLLLLDKWSFERATQPRGRSPWAVYRRRSSDAWFTTEAWRLVDQLA